MVPFRPAVMEPVLAELLAYELGIQLSAQVDVRKVSPLPGHAGVGYSFVADDGSAERKMVIRTIPVGVPATGPADVMRQARIMQSLEGTGVPVPRIYCYGDETSVFGRPHFISEFIAGTALPTTRSSQTPAHAKLARRGIEVMAQLHKVSSENLTPVWGAAQELRIEFDRLYKLFDRPTVDASKAGRLELLRERLLGSAPDEFNSGCVHGDMHFGNMIFGPEDVRAVIDWEIAFLGSTLLDLGMLAFYTDPAAGIPEHRYRAERFVISPGDIIETYSAAWGRPLRRGDVAWHRAFAGYRFAIITLFNEMLHRRGKKLDPMWPDVTRSVSTMVERSLEVLEESEA